MGYLKDLVDECNKLSDIAQEYLSKFEHDNKSMEDLSKEIWNAAWDRVYKLGFTDKNWWDCGDEDATWIIDMGCSPHTNIPRNGSLRYTLGYSIAAQSANLRAYYEHFVNGKELITFKTVAGEDE